jgi:cytochrome c556
MSTHRLVIRTTALALAATLSLGTAQAQDPFANEIGARQSQFRLLAFNVGPLVGMAQGNIPYDAEAAQAAADNLVRIASLDQSLMWPEGSDNMAVDGTRALPAIWENLEDFATKLEGLRSGVAAMQVAAGQDLDALRGALGGVGGACSACHENYREPM